jgi:hypothetical protein
MSDTLYVKPVGGGECDHCGQPVPPEWVVLDDPDGEPLEGPFKARSEAKEAALALRDGEAVKLLRADGSVHSEMRAAGEPDERNEAGLSREDRREARRRRRGTPGVTVQGGVASDGSDR